MEIVTGLPAEDAAAETPVSVAVGNFDGVHRGHRAVLASARRAAERLGARFGVVTFEPHPRRLFRPDDPPFLLTPPALKARRLAALGVERLFVLPFDRTLAGYSAEAFAERVLARGLGAAHVSVGRDFRFGAGRSGDVEALAAFGRRFGFSVEAVAPAGPGQGQGEADGEGDCDSEPFSSSGARQALRRGDPREAARILGDWHRIEGPVLQGDRRGRELGFPTANLSLEGVLQPAFGIYAVRAEVLDGPHAGGYDGVASLGVRPTFGGAEANFETFLFDFSGDLYGAALSVALCAYLRPELKFDSVEALVAQMNRDRLDARAALADLSEPWR